MRWLLNAARRRLRDMLRLEPDAEDVSIRMLNAAFARWLDEQPPEDRRALLIHLLLSESYSTCRLSNRIELHLRAKQQIGVTMDPSCIGLVGGVAIQFATRTDRSGARKHPD